MPIAKFLPTRRSDRLAYLRQAADAMSANFADFGITAPDAAAFDALVTTLETDSAALDAANLAAKAATAVISNPGGSEDLAVTAMRGLGNTFRSDPTVTDETLATIGMTRRDTNNTPKPAPDTAPEFAIESIGQGTVNVRFRTAGAANPRARMPDAVGVQVAIVDGIALPTAGEANSARREFLSRSPNALNTTGYPTVVRLYARWQTQRGLTGPWSDAVTFRPQI